VLVAGWPAGGALGAGALGAEAAGAGVAADGADAAVVAVEDTVSPAACAAAGTTEAADGEDVAGETTTGDEGTGGAGTAEGGAPGSGGSCAADAGRAKITARIMASTKIAARPPQAYTQARRDRVPISLHNPIRERTGMFPSTARKLRQTLCYRAINLTM